MAVFLIGQCYWLNKAIGLGRLLDTMIRKFNVLPCNQTNGVCVIIHYCCNN